MLRRRCSVRPYLRGSGSPRIARAPLGALQSLQLRSAPLPDREYVVIQFASSFANKAAALETVTPMKDADGTWRVSGYYIE